MRLQKHTRKKNIIVIIILLFVYLVVGIFIFCDKYKSQTIPIEEKIIAEINSGSSIFDEEEKVEHLIYTGLFNEGYLCVSQAYNGEISITHILDKDGTLFCDAQRIMSQNLLFPNRNPEKTMRLNVVNFSKTHYYFGMYQGDESYDIFVDGEKVESYRIEIPSGNVVDSVYFWYVVGDQDFPEVKAVLSSATMT